MAQIQLSEFRQRLRHVVLLAWPLILSNVTVPLLGLVDTAVLGHLESPLYLAAVAISGNLFSIIYFAFGFLRMGTTGEVAQQWASGNKHNLTPTQKVQRTFLYSTIMALIIGLVLIIIQPWCFPWAIHLIGAGSDSLPYAELYSDIRIWAAPAALGNMVLIGMFLGIQRPSLTLILMLVINVINIALDLLLVTGLNWHVDGVAWATVFANYSAWLLGLYLLKNALDLKWRQLINLPEWDWQALRKLATLNRDIFIRTLLLMSTFLFFTWRGAQLGDDILAANSVLLTFFFLLSYGLDGFANAAEASVGDTVGRGDYSQLHTTVLAAGFASLLVALGYVLFFALLGKTLVYSVTDIPAVRTTALIYWFWIIPLPLTTVGCFLFDGVFIGATLGREMRNSMAISVLLVFIPAMFFLMPWQNHGLWAAMHLLMLARSATMFWYYRFKVSKLK